MPYYLNENIQGLVIAASLGDGYSINLKWPTAYPSIRTNKIGYNIYMSNGIAPDFPNEFFWNAPTFVKFDGYTNVDIVDLVPGDMYHFGVRAFEYNPLLVNLNVLPLMYNGLHTLPMSLLAADIGLTDVVIDLMDVSGWPVGGGTFKLGVEYIKYSSVDEIGNKLLGVVRGFEGGLIREHKSVDGYDGYSVQNPNAIYWPVEVEEDNTVVFECWNRFDGLNYSFTITDGYRQQSVDILNTNLSYSDSVNANTPPYDFAGYHRTDPVLLLRGDVCLGSYIGGYYGCIDGYSGVGMQLRGLNIQDANIARQEVLLSTTGEPCVLVKRQTTGIRCSCFLPNNEYPEARCNKCFPPGTLIRAENGLVPIETIKIGDRVLSSDGKYYSVTKLFKNNYDGYLQSIYTTTTSKPILSTPEHPFMTMGGAHNKVYPCGPKCNNYIKDGDGKPSTYDIQKTENNRWQARVGKDYKRVVLGRFDTKELAKQAIDDFRNPFYERGHQLEWHEAKCIKENDWLVSKWNKNITDFDKISIPKKFLKNTKLGSQRFGAEEFDLDEDFLWMIGLYLAEGSAGSRSIVFALHKKEIIFQNRIVSLFKKYGFNSRISKGSENGVTVAVNGTSLAGWFSSMFGKRCYTKSIPEIFMNLPNNKTWQLIRGLDDGDGTKDLFENEITQTSEILALQIVELLQRNGKQAIIRTSQHSTLTPKGNKRRSAYHVNWELDNARHDNRKGRWAFKDDVLTKVKKINEVYYSGDVYNLEVEGDHTYVVQNILVHNCFGTGFVVGWNQFFDVRRSDGRIMVRFDPTVDNVVSTESGLESTMNPNCWSLPSPSFASRDFIVRFDEDDNQEFRYEILNVTRNKLFLDQTGAQKFAAQRIRKTDVIYQVPVFYDTSLFPTQISTSVVSSLGLPSHSHVVQVSDKIVSINQINAVSGKSAGHSHAILNGVVQTILGHSHSLIL